MAGQRRGLGKGLGALIPQDDGGQRPRDVFWPNATDSDGGDVPDVLTVQGADVRSGLDDAGGTKPGTKGKGAKKVREGGTPSDTTLEPADDQASGVARLVELPVADIRPNPRQPRQVFDEDDLQELAHSIRELGVMQPIVVRRTETGHELIMGERRLRATKLAGLDTIPAILRETEDEDLLREALLENLHRVQLNPLEEAAAYGQLLDDFGCTHEELAQRLGRSRPRITNSLRLLKLPPSVARRVAAGVLSAGHARALLSLEDGAAMERMAQRIVAEGLSVRSVEELIALGGGREDDKKPRRPSVRALRPEHQEIADDLADRLDTRVSLKVGRKKGTLTVEFAGEEDLQRILGLLAPTE